MSSDAPNSNAAGWPPQRGVLSERLNDRLWFADHDGYRVIYGSWGEPLYHASLGDKVEMRFMAVSLRTSGLATQEDIAWAFGHSVETQRRWERAYAKDGLKGLMPKYAGGQPKVSGSQERMVRKWHADGHSQAEIGRRLGVSRSTISRLEKRLGLKREPAVKPRSTPRSSTSPAEQEDSAEADDSPCMAAPTPAPVAAAESLSAGTCDWRNPLDRSSDRLFARMGLLDDADPIFAAAESLPRAGVLLAIPLLVRSGALQTFERIYGSIGPAFYGLRTTVVCLFMLALLRIKRPENLKEFSPPALGRLLGLDRAPEVKTLRRKLATLAARGRGEELVEALARARADGIDDPSVLGVLYVDGHVIQYHGKHDLAETRITTRNMAGPASTDTWVNDLRGDPLFVIQSELNEDLTQTLEKAMQMARAVVGHDRRITVVFDRGGWSPALFERLIKAGFDIITYRKSTPGRKGKQRKLARSKFEERSLEADGRPIRYQLHDAPRRKVGRRKKPKKGEPKFLWLREVTRLREDGKQTSVLTSLDDDVPAERVLFLMFNRWRQENFFKYMNEEFAFDSLVEYGAGPVEKGRDRPNPARRPIEKKIRKAEAKREIVDRTLGALVSSNEESERPTVRGFKIAHSDLLRERQEVVDEILTLREALDALPRRIPADDLECLLKERKLVAQAIKALAYQAESDLTRLLHPHYKRAEDEGRTLLHAAFQSAARIEVTANELRVTIEPQSSPHRSRAMAQLCAEIEAMGECFPGTDLRLRVAVEVLEPVTC